jgi:hypothetical protein
MEFEQRLEAASALAETSLEEAFGKRRAEWINRLETEHDNLSSLLQELWLGVCPSLMFFCGLMHVCSHLPGVGWRRRARQGSRPKGQHGH